MLLYTSRLEKIIENLSLLSVGKNVDQWELLHDFWEYQLDDHFGNNLALFCKATVCAPCVTSTLSLSLGESCLLALLIQTAASFLAWPRPSSHMVACDLCIQAPQILFICSLVGAPNKSHGSSHVAYYLPALLDSGFVIYFF